MGKKVDEYKDFRKMYERKDMDAVAIITPDHWHGIQFIAAAKAGFDIYCEKPFGHTIYEGRKMVEAARKHKIIAQVGSQRRTNDVYIKAFEEVKKGILGKPVTCRFYRISNMYPVGIGNPPDSDPPPELDWDMWLGPAPSVPYNENRCLYKFRWFFDYSSQTANWGAHYIDMLHWYTGMNGPVKISAIGGKYAVKDNRTIPDTMEVTYEYPDGLIAAFGIYESSSGRGLPDNMEFELRGTDATLYTTYRGYKIVPADKGQFQTRDIPLQPIEYTGDFGDAPHARNFLDCMRSRAECAADVEAGHRASSACELGNIAYKTNSVIEWDPVKERITNDESLNRHLHYEYRKPWKLE